MTDDPDYLPEDAIAARGMAYATLVTTLDTIEDPDIKKEGLLMLKALRLSFKSPAGELIPLKAP